MQADEFEVDHGWLIYRPVYKGTGTARFAKPEGTITGEVQACFDQRGGVQVEMDPADLVAPLSYPFGISQFLGGGRVTKEGGLVTPIFGAVPVCEEVGVAA